MPRWHSSKLLLTALFKGYSGFSFVEMPSVYTDENNERFYTFIKTILSEDDFTTLCSLYRINHSNRLTRDWSRSQIEKEKKRILDILKEPTYLNTILQIYFA